MPQICVYVSDDLLARCKAAAKTEGRSVSNYVAVLIQNGVATGAAKSGVKSQPQRSAPQHATNEKFAPPLKTPREQEESRLWLIYRAMPKEQRELSWDDWRDNEMADWDDDDPPL